MLNPTRTVWITTDTTKSQAASTNKSRAGPIARTAAAMDGACVSRRPVVMGSPSRDGREVARRDPSSVCASRTIARDAQASLARTHDGLGPVDDHELVEDRADVIAHRLDADPEPLTDR